MDYPRGTRPPPLFVLYVRPVVLGASPRLVVVVDPLIVVRVHVLPAFG